jgi:hypothetical protein
VRLTEQAVSELAFRTLIVAAVLAFVQAHTPTLQRPDPSSKSPDYGGDVGDLIRQVLIDRIAAKDIPDFGLLRGATRIAIRSDGLGFGVTLGKDALPTLEGYQLRLISSEEAKAEADRTQASVYFIAVDGLTVSGDTATLSIGVDFAMPPNPKLVKMCCCSRSLEYRRVNGRWVFVRWGHDGLCG